MKKINQKQSEITHTKFPGIRYILIAGYFHETKFLDFVIKKVELIKKKFQNS